ncbi:hypothetical protein FNF27_03239 [Cafeteria roenbergensis]|uniref:VPS37 C-terminal domain-containing protein n=1 Tax=Cafeteria roenbergensis TaxID=33653 RepID=A0A5A8DH71_CAFRO|nr:hypothetical protein FNF28_05936 [Cafeteria roenbergensis]KAA0164735.1 hypothetical protein FNF31_02272 [Cafeteria roenbergensis]KAA0175231.1 hypothetical protein FNF27_03239 [Cafeteria roenbergensis]
MAYPFMQARTPATAAGSDSVDFHTRSLREAYSMGKLESAPGGQTFTVGLQLLDRRVLGVRVIMPHGFPRARPSMVLTNASYPGTEIRHRLVNDAGEVVGLPELASWVPSKPLGGVLQAAMNIFRQNPPTLVSGGAGSGRSSVPIPGGVPRGASGGGSPAYPGTGYPGTGYPSSAASARPGPASPGYPTSGGFPSGGAPPAYPSGGAPPAYPSGGAPPAYPSGGAPPAYPSGGAPPAYPSGGAAASAGSASSGRPSMHSRSPKRPAIPASFPQLESMDTAVLRVMEADASERRSFLKQNVEALRMLRSSVLATLKANRDAAMSLTETPGGEKRAEDTASRIAVLLVQRRDAEEELQKRITRARRVSAALSSQALAAKLEDAASTVDDESNTFRDRIIRGEGRPEGGTDSAERRAWFRSIVGEFARLRARHHSLAARAAIARTCGVAGTSHESTPSTTML